MGVRYIRKQLAGEEDLLLGTGTEDQERQGGTKTITKLRLATVVDTIADLFSVDKTKYTTCIVTDEARGGVFNYDSSKSGINDKGTNFSGWIRQYDGPVNVKWFGDTSKEQTFWDAAIVKQSVLVDPGTYDLDGNTLDFTGKKFHSFGAVTINTNTTLSVTNLVP